jgi:long-chain acyl-CoA synthetase
MNFNKQNTILDSFYHWEKNTPDAIFLKQPFGDTFKDFTWKEAVGQARKIAAYLKSLGLPRKSNIALVSKNCAEWIISDMAILMADHVSVPLYPTLTAEQINQVLVHSESKVAIFGKIDDWEEMKPGIPKDIKCISFPTYNPDPEHIQWNAILANTEGIKEDFKPKLEDLMTIIYTSGTTGNPKGVMMDFNAHTQVMLGAREYSKMDNRNTRFFSYLPLCHIAERNLVESTAIISGGTIYFAENLDTFAQNLVNAHPTHFLAVPRIWTKFQQGILGKLSQSKLDILLKIPIVSSLIKAKVVKGLGLQDAYLTLTGAAPMPISTILWFRKLGIIIQEAYGMTENMGAMSCMPRENIKDGYVGKIYPYQEVKTDENSGEILGKSPWNMIGYYREPELTKKTLDDDGWLHTGDVGELDSNGYLKITGRVKEMYKTSKGEYIAPSKIEVLFGVDPVIDQICLIGQSLPQPIALVVLSEAGLKLSEKEIKANFIKLLEEINPVLKTYERVKKIVIVKEQWTVENNKLTPTFKIKRNFIEKEFESRSEGWYEAPETIIYE